MSNFYVCTYFSTAEIPAVHKVFPSCHTVTPFYFQHIMSKMDYVQFILALSGLLPFKFVPGPLGTVLQNF